MYLERHICSYIQRMQKQFKVLLITGSRQVGKSTMLLKTFSNMYNYVLLDDYMELDLAKKDPNLFLKNHKLPLVIDEVQRATELFLQIKYLVDKDQNKGLVILTGSQSYKLLHNAKESLAGRICLIDMPSLSMREINHIDFKMEFIPTDDYKVQRESKIQKYNDIWHQIHRGSMPELLNQDIEWESYYRSYVRTYIERDVIDLINTKNLLKFSNFMRCLAARTGELINNADLARDLGLSVKTIQEWISILEASGIIRLLHSYENNITNRTIKTPKLYFMDTGLVCYLVGWSNETVAMNGAMSGALFETFVISEIIKTYLNAGHDTQNLYFYRDKDKHEIDLVIEKDGILYPVEIKKAARVSKDMAKHFSVLKKIPQKQIGRGCIICQCDSALELKDDLIALPIDYI